MSEKWTGCPRQRVQGSRRRNRRDAGDEVGESYLLRQIKLNKFELRRGDREADGARLLSECSVCYRGFESLPLRHVHHRNLKGIRSGASAD